MQKYLSIGQKREALPPMASKFSNHKMISKSYSQINLQRSGWDLDCTNISILSGD